MAALEAPPTKQAKTSGGDQTPASARKRKTGGGGGKQQGGEVVVTGSSGDATMVGPQDQAISSHLQVLYKMSLNSQ